MRVGRRRDELGQPPRLRPLRAQRRGQARDRRGRVRPVHGRADGAGGEAAAGSAHPRGRGRPAARGGRPSLAPRPRRVAQAASRERVDVFLFPSLYTWFPVRGAPTVVGIHDVIAEQYPELTLPDRGDRARWRLKRWLAVKRATKLFTVSRASRRLLAADLGVPEASLAVVPEAPDPVFGPRTAEEIDEELGPLGLDSGERFLVYAGGVSPHKGLETLARRLRAARRAGAAARRRGRARGRDVPVGGQRGSPADRRARTGEPRAADRLCLRRGSRLSLRGRAWRSSRRRGRRGSVFPPSRLRPPARPSCSATSRRIARRWKAPRSTSRRVIARDSGRAARDRCSRRRAPRRAWRGGAAAAWRAFRGTRRRRLCTPCCMRPPVPEPLSICMVTTFYPPLHFGGDAAYAYRLANALARRGHAVTVVHSADAYRALGGERRRRVCRTTPGVTVHRLQTRSATGSSRWPRTSPVGRRSTQSSCTTCSTAAASTSSTSTTSRWPAGRACSRTATPSSCTRPRTLARVPDARAVPLQPRAVRRAALPALHACLPPATAALALLGSARARGEARRPLPLAEPLHP